MLLKTFLLAAAACTVVSAAAAATPAYIFVTTLNDDLSPAERAIQLANAAEETAQNPRITVDITGPVVVTTVFTHTAQQTAIDIFTTAFAVNKKVQSRTVAISTYGLADTTQPEIAKAIALATPNVYRKWNVTLTTAPTPANIETIEGTSTAANATHPRVSSRVHNDKYVAVTVYEGPANTTTDAVDRINAELAESKYLGFAVTSFVADTVTPTPTPTYDSTTPVYLVLAALHVDPLPADATAITVVQNATATTPRVTRQLAGPVLIVTVYHHPRAQAFIADAVHGLPAYKVDDLVVSKYHIGAVEKGEFNATNAKKAAFLAKYNPAPKYVRIMTMNDTIAAADVEMLRTSGSVASELAPRMRMLAWENKIALVLYAHANIQDAVSGSFNDSKVGAEMGVEDDFSRGYKVTASAVGTYDEMKSQLPSSVFTDTSGEDGSGPVPPSSSGGSGSAAIIIPIVVVVVVIILVVAAVLVYLFVFRKHKHEKRVVPVVATKERDNAAYGGAANA